MADSITVNTEQQVKDKAALVLQREWRNHLILGIRGMFQTDAMLKCISEEHTKKTPVRFLAALDEYFAGINEDPHELLQKALFPSPNDKPQMIHISGQSFYSTCAHHLAPILGVMHFAYIPDGHIIGLSKIPRLIEIYARRPQVQEQLTDNIVDAFYDIVKPKGCALLVKARHFCMEARGVRAHGTLTTTTALRGIFFDEKVRAEFLMSANHLEL